MSTYASPRLTRSALSISLTITFLIGLFIIFYGILHTINSISDNARRHRLTTSGENLDYTNMKNIMIEDFPSTSSPITELIIGMMTLCHSILGIIAINLERPHLFSVHAYLLLMSCSIKLLFVVASTFMHMVSRANDFWTLIAQLALITCLLELVLILCGCQYAKLLKMGDAARQEIQSLHSYHLERRSRSRSISRARSMYGSRALLPSRFANSSLNEVRPEELILKPYDRYYYDKENATFIIPPPPIFLELDR